MRIKYLTVLVLICAVMLSGCNETDSKLYFQRSASLGSILDGIAILAMTPTRAANNEPITVLIKGVGFQPGLKLFVNGRRYLTKWIDFGSETCLKIFVPENAPAGEYTVYIKNPDGTKSNKARFIVTSVDVNEKRG